MNDAPLLRRVPIARCSGLDSETFKRTFLGRAPVIVCGAMENWAACRTWSHAWFAEHYGQLAMHVQTWTDGRMGGEERAIGELVELMGQPNGVLRCLARAPMFESAPELRRHFALPAFVQAPSAASYLFMGPPDLVTPIHFELSDGILAQVVGSKRALLFPPELRRRLGYPPLYRKRFWFSSFDPDTSDLSVFSALGGACAFVGEVGPGELLYVPSRWHHHVRALEATISVNFLWKRGAARVASALLKRLGREYG